VRAADWCQMAADHVAERNGPGRACRTWRTGTGVVAEPGRTRARSSVAARLHIKRGRPMPSDVKCQTRPGIPAASLERNRSDCERDRLLRAAINAGLEPSTVVGVAEALTGQSWASLGAPEVVTVARELLCA